MNFLVTEADQVTIEAGDVRYVFSPKNGQLVSAELKGKQLIKKTCIRLSGVN